MNLHPRPSGNNQSERDRAHVKLSYLREARYLVLSLSAWTSWLCLLVYLINR